MSKDSTHVPDLYPYIVEYVWMDSDGKFRSKTRVLVDACETDPFPDWSYDGSSTGQAATENSEIILRPYLCYKDPFRHQRKNYINIGAGCYIVLCGMYHLDADGNETAVAQHTRDAALEIFDMYSDQKPWYGLEQEFFIKGVGMSRVSDVKTDQHYCGRCSGEVFSAHENLMERFMNNCLQAGVKLSGINAEVANAQWEFQVGPCEGVRAADDLMMARYILQRTAKELSLSVTMIPKISYESGINGSGCHTNFSTKNMRNIGGIDFIKVAIKNIGTHHEDYMKLTGKGNKHRMTGTNETSSYNTFTYGAGSRNTSVRIPIQVSKAGYGYLEDRRPGANIDPYVITSNLLAMAMKPKPVYKCDPCNYATNYESNGLKHDSSIHHQKKVNAYTCIGDDNIV